MREVSPSNSAASGPQPGDWVVCHQRCSVPWLGEYFELAPEDGEAFQVISTGLPVPPGFGEELNGLQLLGVLDPDGEEPHFGMPATRFAVCPEVEAEPGWQIYRQRLDRHRLSRFYKLVNAGTAFESLPPLLRQWWMQRY